MINDIRHREVFDASLYLDRHIVIVGAGATGSRCFEQLVSTGLTNITLVDFDRVEDHNLANQLFTRDDIGALKVDACKEWAIRKVGEQSANKISYVAKKVKPSNGCDILGFSPAVVVSSVDSFKARKMLLEVSQSVMADSLFDTRMATNNFHFYSVDMEDPQQVSSYLSTIGDDDDPRYEVSACGSTLTVGATATICGSFLAWQVMGYLRDNFLEYKLKMVTFPPELSRSF